MIVTSLLHRHSSAKTHRDGSNRYANGLATSD